MPTLLKISENEYRVSGEVDARFSELKTVTVDGVEYSRTDYIERRFSYDDDFNKPDRFYWQKIEISEFSFLEIPDIVIWDYTGWQYGTALDDIAAFDTKFSSGGVNPLIFVFKTGLIDSRVKDVYHSKKQTWQTYKDQDEETEEHLYRYGIIHILIRSYGFQNRIYCSISIHSFLCLNMSLFRNSEHYRALHRLIPEILTTRKYMSDETKLIVAFRLFESQIKYFENENLNEQRSFHAYMRSNGKAVPEEDNG